MDLRALQAEVDYRREVAERMASAQRARRRGSHVVVGTPPSSRRPARRATSLDAATRRRGVGRVLLLIAAGALLSAAGALSVLPNVEPEIALLGAWRTSGLVVFAGLLVLVARDPLGYPGVPELAIVHAAVLTASALLWPDAPKAELILAAAGMLTVVLVVAYVLLGCHGRWHREDGHHQMAHTLGHRGSLP
jgi:hypothetical protein